MAARLRVNGQTFRRFKALNGVYSRDTFCGEVQITVSEAVNNESPIKIGDLIEIFLDGIQRFTGYIEKITDSLDPSTHDVNFTARDIVADLVDSSVPASVKNLENITTFKQLVQLCITGLGLQNDISIIDNVNASIGPAEIKAAETGQTVGDFLNEYARVANVFLNTDGKGNVLIQQNAGELKTILQLAPSAVNNNIKSSSLVIDDSDRFYKYTVYSNSSLSAEDTTVDDINNSGEAFDTDIRTSRVFEKIAEKPMTEAQCKAAAQEEANIRRARSFNYSCQVVGFSANGELWQPGKLVMVKDTLRGVSGKFLINQITWSETNEGDIVDIAITLPDKNTDEADASSLTKKTTVGSSTYGVQSGDTLSSIAKKFSVTVNDLIIANPKIKDPDVIFTGENVNIPISGGLE